METRDKDNETCLNHSILHGHESVVRLLLERGIDVNIRGEGNNTPLITAAKAGQDRITKLLIKRGVDLNLQNQIGGSALMMAAYTYQTNIVRELLEAGADRDIEDYESDTVLQYTEDHDIILLLDRGQIQDEKKGAKAVLEATEAGCPNVVSDLLARGAKMDYKNDMGESPFHIAARLPKTRKDEFEELLKDVRRKKENNPKESIADILREAEKVSKDCKCFSFSVSRKARSNINFKSNV